MTLPIGSKAPDFDLPGIDGKNYTLKSFEDAKVLVIAFICNHCPTSQAYEERLIKLTSDYASRGVSLVAINSNNPGSLRYDELGWSDVGDSFDDMKQGSGNALPIFLFVRWRTADSSEQYGPVATPHLFIFDKDRILRVYGIVDDMENPQKRLTRGTPVQPLKHYSIIGVYSSDQSFGCSIKWLEKRLDEKGGYQWAQEPVALDTIGSSSL